MKNETNALIVTAQALSITSQLLAIGIEIGIIAAGYFAYKKLKKDFEETPKVEVVEPSKPEKKTLRQQFGKAKQIFKALTS